MARNLKLIDAVVALHEIASLVEQEIKEVSPLTALLLASEIKRCAEQIHEISIIEGKVDHIIGKAKE